MSSAKVELSTNECMSSWDVRSGSDSLRVSSIALALARASGEFYSSKFCAMLATKNMTNISKDRKAGVSPE